VGGLDLLCALALRRAHVQRHHDRADPPDREHRDHELARVGERDRDRFATQHSEVGELRGAGCHRGLDLGAGHRALGVGEE